MKISLVIPVYNEHQGLAELAQRSSATLAGLGYDFEIIFVNDGSKDRSGEVIDQLAQSDQRVKGIHFTKNFGQTAAIAAGTENSSGDVIVLMDSDLENHPEDIPKLIEKLLEGHDVVSGWRVNRWEGQALTRRFPSRTANWMISKLARLDLNDYGCTLKAYRAENIKGLRLYGDMHRFIPAYLSWQGARVAEVPVQFTPRKYGSSKYGISRILKVLLDLVVLKFITKYFHKPMHFFGGAGIISIFLGVLAGALAAYYKFSALHQKDFISTPLPVVMALFVIVGVLFILMGLLAEILMRTYHESQGKTVHSIRRKVNL